MRRMGQVRPVSVEVLDHVHGAVLELSAEFGAYDVRLHRGVGRSGLAHQLEARPALLLAETGLVSRALDVEDHRLLLFCWLRLTSSTRFPDPAIEFWRVAVLGRQSRNPRSRR